jgi:hypothetical protein
MSVVRRSPVRWIPPEYGAPFRRKEDGTVWTVCGVYRHDRQVRLEREGCRAVFPFDSMLATDYEEMAV